MRYLEIYHLKTTMQFDEYSMPRILQLSGLSICLNPRNPKDFKIIDKYNYYIKHKILNLSQEKICKFYGIDKKKLDDIGEEWDKLAPSIFKKFNKKTLIGYNNINYDNIILANNLEARGYDSKLFIINNSIDCMHIEDKNKIVNSSNSNTLDSLIKSLKISNTRINLCCRSLYNFDLKLSEIKDNRTDVIKIFYIWVERGCLYE